MRTGERGVTYVELLAVTGILMVVGLAVLPIARKMDQRRKEVELRLALQSLRRGIDKFNWYCDEFGPVTPNGLKIEPRHPPYPSKLEDLVEEKAYIGSVSQLKFQALRRIPVDPMTNSKDWGLRCYEQAHDSTSWCGSNVYDVFTKSPGRALDGSKYQEW